MPTIVVIIVFVVALLLGGGAGYFAKQMLSGGEDAAVEESEHGEDHGDGADDGHSDEHSDDGHDGGHDDGHDDGHGDDRHGDDGHGDKAKRGAKDDHGDGDASLDPSINFFKFSRQFVVPIINEEGVRSLVILDLNLAMEDGAVEDFYIGEPKFRDALMKELLDIANEGRFSGVLTDRRNLDLIRMDLLAAVKDIAHDRVHEVLILDIMRQDL